MKTFKIIPVLLTVLLLSVMARAQENKYILNPRGEVLPLKVLNYSTPTQNNVNLKQNVFGDISFNPDGWGDTISYRYLFGPFGGYNFGFFGQDRMLQWFNLDCMEIVAVGLMCYENDLNAQASVKLVKFNWDEEILDTISSPQRLGYYEADGNGYNNITAFLDDPDRTGPWIDIAGNNIESPFVEDIWSDNGSGYVFTPIPDPGVTNYNWIQLDEPVEVGFCGPELIGVVVKNLFPVMDSTRIGWYAADNDVTGIPPAFKFHANGRIEPGVDYGWWTRKFTWDFALAVNIIYDCYPMPIIYYYTILATTTSTEPRLVEAHIPTQFPGFCNIYLEEVLLQFSTDGGINWTDSVMTATGEPDYYSAYIPGFPPGTEVTYKIYAINNIGLTYISVPVVYNIFIVENPNLVVFNGYHTESGYPQDYYFGSDIHGGSSEFPHDVWAFGPLTTELANNYTNIVEFATTGPKDYNDSVITNWLSEDGSRNYFLAGQEWLGLRHAFNDTDFVAGDFEFDVLGVKHSYNDVSFDGAGGQELPTLVFPQQGTMFGGPLFDLFAANPTDSMQYNPAFEIGVTNWVDAFDVVSGQEVDMKLETRGIDGQPNVQILPCGTHRELAGGNKIVFLSYDPLSLNSSPEYTWYGYTNENTPYQILSWFDIPVGIEEENVENKIPAKFILSQNYPNPFNPSTIITWQSPVGSWQTLKVYDILGNEVASLVDEYKPAGNYEVEFNPGSGIRNLASGIYFYQLKAGSFIQTKKMLILK